MNIVSSAFPNGGHIPKKYTCEGENIHPPFRFENIPQNAQSLVFVVTDPDVPLSIRKDGLWVHWLVFDIAPSTQYVEEGKGFPSGVEGIQTSFGNTYVGPCPPDREHRYFFTLYALDCFLHLTENATLSQIKKAMEGHIVEEASLLGTYTLSRNKGL